MTLNPSWTNDVIRERLQAGETPRQIALEAVPVGSGRGSVARRRAIEHRAYMLSDRKVMLPTWIPEDLDQAVKEHAARNGVSVTEVVMQALKAYLR